MTGIRSVTRPVSQGSYGDILWAGLGGKALVREVLTRSINSPTDGQVQAPPCTLWRKLLISQFPNLRNGNNPIMGKVFPLCQAQGIHNASSSSCLPGPMLVGVPRFYTTKPRLSSRSPQKHFRIGRGSVHSQILFSFH